MKRILLFGGHLLASLFLFSLVGMAFSILLIQNKLIDMRFDTEYLILVFFLTGLWFYFLRLFMNGEAFSIWAKKRTGFVVATISLAIIIIITLVKKSFFILPAYAFRKAFFLENSVTLSQTNVWIVVFFVIGVAAMSYVQGKPLSFVKGAPMDWNQFSRKRKVGFMSLYFLCAFVLLFYLGQGEFQSSMNHAMGVLKDADVEAFRDYLLSYGPLAAVVSGFLMVFQSIMAPLPAFVITFANGLLFGWFWGAILSWSSAMLGAVICYYIAKIVGRPVVEKIVSKQALSWWDRFFDKYGKHSVFIARLVPIVSFDLVSYAAGVTTLSFWQFFWATGLGQLPATILYSYLGQNATGTVQILFFMFTIVIALAVIGMLLRPKFKFSQKAKGMNGE